MEENMFTLNERNKKQKKNEELEKIIWKQKSSTMIKYHSIQ